MEDATFNHHALMKFVVAVQPAEALDRDAVDDDATLFSLYAPPVNMVLFCDFARHGRHVEMNIAKVVGPCASEEIYGCCYRCLERTDSPVKGGKVRASCRAAETAVVPIAVHASRSRVDGVQGVDHYQILRG